MEGQKVDLLEDPDKAKVVDKKEGVSWLSYLCKIKLSQSSFLSPFNSNEGITSTDDI